MGPARPSSADYARRERVCARPASDSDPVRRHGPERGETGGGGRPRSFPSGPLAGTALELREPLELAPAGAARPPSSRAGGTRRASSRSESVGWRTRRRGDLAQLRRELVEPALALEPPDRPELRLGGAARAHDVRVVGVGEPVRPGARRRDDGLLAEAQRRLLRAEEREELGDRLDALRVRDRVPAPLVDRRAGSPPPRASSARNARRARRRPPAARDGRSAARSPSRRRETRRADRRPGSTGGRRRAAGGRSSGARFASRMPASFSACRARASSSRWSWKRVACSKARRR